MWYQETGISPLQNARGLKKQQKYWMKNLGLLVSEPIAIRFIVLLLKTQPAWKGLKVKGEGVLANDVRETLVHGLSYQVLLAQP